MDSSIRTDTPLRQRRIDEMRMRKLEHKTQEAYIRAVCKRASFLRRSPDTASVEDLRRFQLYLVNQGTSPITLNATLTGLKFTFDRRELKAKMQPVRMAHTLPVVLSREEVAPRNAHRHRYRCGSSRIQSCRRRNEEYCFEDLAWHRFAE